MAGHRTTQRRLLATLDRLEPRLRAEVERALRALRTSVSLDDLTQMIVLGDTVALARVTRTLSRRLQRAAAIVARAYEVGRATAGETFTGTVAATLQTPNPYAIRAAAADESARLVTNVTTETRRAIRTIVAVASEEGLAPRETARLLRPLLGLTRRQAQAVMRFRAREMNREWGGPLEGRSLSIQDRVLFREAQARVEAKTRRYADRLLRRRAVVIARTETLRAANAGQLALWRDLVRQGLLPPTAHKRWMVADDDRLCQYCRPLDKQTQTLGGEFVSGPWRAEAPPLHPQCRCTLVLAVEAVARRAA